MFDTWVRAWQTWWHPDEYPVPQGPTTHDPFLGIGKRRERVMLAKEEELRAFKVPKKDWDYCAHKLLELEKCRADNFPIMTKCKHEAHDASMCYLDDYILRMKEYEREKRLIQRDIRLKQNA